MLFKPSHEILATFDYLLVHINKKIIDVSFAE